MFFQCGRWRESQFHRGSSRTTLSSLRLFFIRMREFHRVMVQWSWKSPTKAFQACFFPGTSLAQPMCLSVPHTRLWVLFPCQALALCKPIPALVVGISTCCCDWQDTTPWHPTKRESRSVTHPVTRFVFQLLLAEVPGSSLKPWPFWLQHTFVSGVLGHPVALQLLPNWRALSDCF